MLANIAARFREALNYLRARLAERTSVNAIRAFLLAAASTLGASMAAAVSFENAAYAAAGAGIVAVTATLTKEGEQ